MEPLRRMVASDAFRRFADMLDQGHKLAEVADPQYVRLTAMMKALQWYGRNCLGVDILPRNFDVVRVPGYLAGDDKGGVPT